MSVQTRHRFRTHGRHSFRTGITVTEAVVGMTIIAVVISTTSRLHVNSRRVLLQTRHQQLVLDELTMLAENALATGSTQRDLPELSNALKRSLPSAVLDRDIRPDGDSQRVTWSIGWTITASTSARHAVSRSLSVWLPASQESP